MRFWVIVLSAMMLTANVFGLEIKEILIVGDGMTKNAPMPELGWQGNWGMAATSEAQDYAHQLFDRVKTVYPGAKLSIDNIMYEDTMTGWVHLVPNSADAIIIQLGDNYKGGVTPEEYQAAYQQMIGELRGETGKPVICIGPWSNEKIEPFIAAAVKAAGAKFVSLRTIVKDPVNSAGADSVYPQLSTRPGNRGMKAIAEAVWKALSEK